MSFQHTPKQKGKSFYSQDGAALSYKSLDTSIDLDCLDIQIFSSCPDSDMTEGFVADATETSHMPASHKDQAGYCPHAQFLQKMPISADKHEKDTVRQSKPKPQLGKKLHEFVKKFTIQKSSGFSQLYRQPLSVM